MVKNRTVVEYIFFCCAKLAKYRYSYSSSRHRVARNKKNYFLVSETAIIHNVFYFGGKPRVIVLRNIFKEGRITQNEEQPTKERGTLIKSKFLKGKEGISLCKKMVISY